MSQAALSASRYYIRRAQRSRQFIASATPWASGLTIVEGDIVQANAMAWQAQNDGTTAGTTAPNNSNGALFTDAGEVKWLHVPLLLVQPEPI